MAQIPQVVSWASAREFVLCPVSGAGSNIPLGTPLMPGVTAGTNDGVLIPITASSNADIVGLLGEFHNFSASGDATTATLANWFPSEGFNSQQGLQASTVFYPNIFPSHRISLLDTGVLMQMDYAITAAFSGIAATSRTVTTATSSTVISNGSCQGAFDSAYVYFSAGTAIGQLGFIKSSIASTSFTLTSALTTNFLALDTMVLVNPLFYATPTWLVNNTTVPTLVDSGLAAGSGAATQIATFISRNGFSQRLDPKRHHNTQGLNTLSALRFYGYWALTDTMFHPGS